MTKIKSTILAIGAAGQFASLVVPELAKRGAKVRGFRLAICPKPQRFRLDPSEATKSFPAGLVVRQVPDGDSPWILVLNLFACTRCGNCAQHGFAFRTPNESGENPCRSDT
jgi:hypothetical protein